MSSMLTPYTLCIPIICTVRTCSMNALTCAGGDCIGLLSRMMCCSCLSFLYAAGISVILLQEKSKRMRGRSANSASTDREELHKLLSLNVMHCHQHVMRTCLLCWWIRSNQCTHCSTFQTKVGQRWSFTWADLMS